MVRSSRRDLADVVVNGRFLSQPTTGVQRYAREIVRGIDRLLSMKTTARYPIVELLVPPNAKIESYKLTNFRIRCAGRCQGVAWEQCELPWIARKSLLVNLANSGPLMHRRQIVCIHDAAVHAVPQYYSFKFRAWYHLLHGWLTKRARALITVSNFSAGQLKEFYGVDSQTVHVVSNASQHILEFEADNNVLERHNLTSGQYIFAFGSHDPSKNMILLEQALELLPEPRPKLVVAGRINSAIFAGNVKRELASTMCVGPVTDAELRALYTHAMCFVLPSFYEGFGTPALEAMACGCPVIVARAAALPEVCGEAALYCDPANPLELAQQIRNLQHDGVVRADLRRFGQARVSKFSWDDSAAKILRLICDELDMEEAKPVADRRQLEARVA